ncbi:hypothetical protein F7734_02155 [Scytonema sp. UIC 10036]|uniref:hypothetical protein n=1 Tax=Scytonema sp. UIC 10036 TaxID=2304196 RepID=UPI0012DA0CC3|nr:hypothetical protein [Scytonema sp. UIC 10036]MUG91354.1 hypothetical protein [Scytonema sp. UIC 10036]
MLSTEELALKQTVTRQNPWFNRLIAIIAVMNLFLVFFDLSYVPWRNLYVLEIPSLTQLYDPIKGIEPHRDTQNYLNKVYQLEEQVFHIGLRSPNTENLLEELRVKSDEMIKDNPFAGANKSGTLERIKNLMRDRMGIESAHQAFRLFWSEAHFETAGWQPEIQFFKTHIQPLIQTNYYRKIGINGKFINRFWQIDLPFVALFFLDFLGRTFLRSRQAIGLTWQQAMVRRWYDIFLLLPFWQWLRVIPVIVRLNQAHLLNLDEVRQQINHELVANFAEELTEIIAIRLITQIQESIQQGNIINWFLRPQTRHNYIDINNTNEIKAIARRLLQISVYQVVPKIQPDLETLLHRSIHTMLSQSPTYQQLQKVPGFNQLPNQLTEKLVTDISQTAYATMTILLEDPEVAAISNRLIDNFSAVLEIEIQNKQNVQEIRSLLIDLLEEIKINYVKGIAEGGVEKSLQEATQIRQIIQH